MANKPQIKSQAKPAQPSKPTPGKPTPTGK